MAALTSLTKSEAIRFVALLIQQTQHDMLQWSGCSSSELPHVTDDEELGACYVSVFHGRSLRLYVLMREAHALGIGSLETIELGIGAPPRSRRQWNRRVVLQLATRDGLNWWTFPSVKPVEDLLAAVEHQAAGLDEFFREVFAEEGETQSAEGKLDLSSGG